MIHKCDCVHIYEARMAGFRWPWKRGNVACSTGIIESFWLYQPLLYDIARTMNYDLSFCYNDFLSFSYIFILHILTCVSTATWTTERYKVNKWLFSLFSKCTGAEIDWHSIIRTLYLLRGCVLHSLAIWTQFKITEIISARITCDLCMTDDYGPIYIIHLLCSRNFRLITMIN